MDMLKDIKKDKKKLVKKETKAQKGKKTRRSKKEIKEYNKLVLMGNQLSKGTSTAGTNNNDLSSALNLYAENLLVKLRPLWTLPAYLKKLDLRCRIQIFFVWFWKAYKGRYY